MSDVNMLLKPFGGVKAVAKRLDLSESGIRNWPKRGIPAEIKLELLAWAEDAEISLSEEERRGLLSTTRRKDGAGVGGINISDASAPALPGRSNADV